MDSAAREREISRAPTWESPGVRSLILQAINALRRGPSIWPAWRCRNRRLSCWPAPDWWRCGCGRGAGLQRREHLFGVSLRLYFGEDLSDTSVRSDDEGGSHNAHPFLAVHVLLLVDTVGLRGFLIDVA